MAITICPGASRNGSSTRIRSISGVVVKSCEEMAMANTTTIISRRAANVTSEGLWSAGVMDVYGAGGGASRTADGGGGATIIWIWNTIKRTRDGPNMANRRI